MVFSLYGSDNPGMVHRVPPTDQRLRLWKYLRNHAPDEKQISPIDESGLAGAVQHHETGNV
jgi:hypothetical protein